MKKEVVNFQRKKTWWHKR